MTNIIKHMLPEPYKYACMLKTWRQAGAQEIFIKLTSTAVAIKPTFSIHRLVGFILQAFATTVLFEAVP